MPFPSHINPNSSRAPWNAPPAPECPDCERVIHDGRDHEADCPLAGVDDEELHRQLVEDAEADTAEQRFEQQRVDNHRPNQ
ncbi:hypothetical protein [Halohasta litorea]|uniref:Small CPxCG-related zinc finger protein n=1 Tax=Halohasta litorea TaxID=869891 RepID=A0ABD6DED8_9EURY|nr:hypothetical protein [Halohasta litorea]